MAHSAQAPVDYKAIFEKAPGLYLILDPELRIVAASDAYCRATLIDRARVLGRDIFEVFPDDAAREGADGVANLRASLERVVRLRRTDAMAIQRYDVRAAGPGAGFEERYWAPLNAPLIGDDGRLLYIIHRVHDVTEAIRHPDVEGSQVRLVRSQEAVIRRLREANRELAQLDALRTGLLQMSRLNTIAMMASALAHDVSQPLTAAKNYLSALRRGRARTSDPKAEDLVAKIGLQIERASEIVRTVRSYMAAGNTVHRPERIAAVVADAAKLADQGLQSAGAQLILDVDPALEPVEMDRVQIQQAIVNLLSNAAEAVSGRARREIKVSAALMGDVLRIAVADTGAGLPEEVSKRLAEPLATTTLIGLGLGLPICRQIAEEHKGTITAAPNHPEGTVFTLSIARGASDRAA